MDEIVYMPYDPEGYNDDLEELGIDQYDVANAAEVIARKGRINIMKNMNLTGFLINQSNNDVAGALWVNEPTVDDYFSFDMTIHPNYRGRGLADKLVKAMIEEYKFHNSIYMEMHNRRLPLQITVVNPILINVLKKYGFRITRQIDSEKAYMTHDTLKEHNLIKIVNEESDEFLSENRNKAIKFLTDNNLDPNMTERGKRMLNDIVQITRGDGFTELLLRFHLEQRIDLDSLRQLYNLLRNYRTELNKLPRNVVEYDSYMQLITDLMFLQKTKEFKRVYDKLPRQLKNSYDNAPDTTKKIFTNTVEKYNRLEPEEQKGYDWGNAGRYNDIGELINSLGSYIQAVELGLTYEKTINQINADDDATLVHADPDNKIVIAHIKSFRASEKFGAPTRWCIKDYEFRYKEYKKGGREYFFIWDYKLPIADSEFMLGLAYKMGNLENSLMFNKPNTGVNPQRELSKKNIDVSILDTFIEANNLELFKSVGDNQFFHHLHNDDDVAILRAIQESEFIREHGNPQNVHVGRGLIELGIRGEALADALETDYYEYNYIRQHERGYAHDYYDSHEKNYMYRYLSEDNIELIKEIIIGVGDKHRFLDNIEDVGVLLDFSETYDLDIDDIFLEKLNEEAGRVMMNEAENVIKSIKIDINAGDISKRDMMTIISESNGEITSFDGLMNRIKELCEEHIPEFSMYIGDALDNNLDTDDLNNEIYDRLTDILENIDDYKPHIDFTYDDVVDYIKRVGFVESSPKNYYYKLKDKTIFITDFQYRDDKLYAGVIIKHDDEYFKKTNQAKPKDTKGFMSMKSLITHIQHYSIPGLDESIIKIVNEEIRLLNEAPASQIWEKYYNTIPHEQFLDIIAADPTSDVEKDKMGKYSKWLLNLYKRKSMQYEDLYKAEKYLETFEKYINRIENKDINKYRSLGDLYNAIRGFIDSDEPTSRNDAIRQIKKDAQKVFEDDTWLVVVPETMEAACYYGKNTQWCTAAEQSENMFDSYNRKGNLYININKKTNEKYQFHFEEQEFKDETDKDILPNDIGISPSTKLFNFYESRGYEIPEPTIEYAIKNGDWDLLQDLLYYDEKTQATEDDFDYAMDVSEYSMADEIFWNIDINNLSRWAGKNYLEYFDTLNDGRFYPKDETNNRYVNAIKETVEHIMQIENIDEDNVLKFVFNKLEEIENIKMVLNKNFSELVDRLINSDLSPNDLEDIAYTFDIEEETVYGLVQTYKVREEFKKITNKPTENDRIKINVKQINFDEDENKFYCFVNILFKKDNKKYEGWLEKSKVYRLLTQYDLFHGE